jgi:4-amino-4-deoxy-L-arabinose transferase-like glycosyltransferase
MRIRMRVTEKFTRPQRIKIGVLVALAAVHTVVSLVGVIPGYVTIDEAYFHWMTKSFHDTGDLSLWNGYEEFPSPELIHPYVQLHRGRLSPPSPSPYAVLASPLYHFAGFRGLFLLNALALVGVAVFCYLAAGRLFRDRDLALDACLILVVSTYAWEYSQAAWPHVTAMLFVAAAFFLFVCAYEASPGGKARWTAFAAGVVAGFGMGMRLDTVLVLPGLMLPFLFARPWRPKEAAMVLAGAIPGATALAMTNLAKFGAFSPFSYGQEGMQAYNRPAAPPYEMIVAAGAVTLLAWALTRSRVSHVPIMRRAGLFLTLTAVVFCALWACTDAAQRVSQTMEGALISLVDIRFLDPHVLFSPMTRSSGGGVLYIGAHKKALLQSLPFLTALLIPLARVVCRDRDAPALATLFLTPTIITGYFAYAFFEGEAGGGLCLNQRYLLPCLPFFCILTAYGVRELTAACNGKSLISAAVAAAGAAAGVYFLLTAAYSPSADQLEFPLLVVPLILAAPLGLTILLACSTGTSEFPRCRMVAWSFLVAALTWATLVSFWYDYPAYQHARKANYHFCRQLLEVVPPDSLFVAGHGFFTTAVALIERTRVRIAYPARDNFADLSRLVAFHRSAGRPIFGVFRNEQWSALQAGPLRSCRVTPVLTFGEFFVGEIVCR